MAYGTKYIINATSYNGYTLICYLKKNQYTGSSTEINGAITPFKHTMKSDSDSTEDLILMGGFRLMIDCVTDMQFVDLFTSDAREYLVEIVKAGTIQLKGWIVPDYFSQPWNAAPYSVILYITDGLGELNNKYYLDTDGTKYEGKKKIKTALHDILQKTGLNLPYREAVNIYEENHDQTDSDSMIKQTYFDAERFDGMTCYEVLNEILKIMGPAQIWQEDGYWNIVSLNNRKNGTYTRRIYDYNFDIVTHSSADEQKEITLTGNRLTQNFWWEEPVLTILPGWKKFILSQSLGKRTNLIKWGNYQKHGNIDKVVENKAIDKMSRSEGDTIYINEAVVNQKVRRLYFRAKYGTGIDFDDYVKWNIGYFNTDPDQRIYFEINNWRNNLNVCYQNYDRYCHLIIILKLDTNSTYYSMTSSGRWLEGKHYVLDTTDDIVNFKITARNALPADGTVSMIIEAQIMDYVDNPSGFVQVPVNFYVDNDDDFVLNIVSPTVDIESIDVETSINDKQNYIPDTYNVMLGDLPTFDNSNLLYTGGLYYVDGGLFIPTEKWQVKNTSGWKNLINLISDEISINHVRPQWMISGELRANFKPGTLIHDTWAGRYFIMKRFEYDMYNDNWDIDAVEISMDSEGYLKLRSGGYIKLRGGGKIKLRK